MKKVLVLLLTLALLLCASGLAESDQEDVLIFYIGRDANSLFWQTCNAGAEQAAADLGFELRSLNPQSESDINGQIDMIVNAMNAGADGIALSPLDTQASISICQEVMAAGIKLTMIDSVVASEDYDVAYRTDNFAAGAACAQTLAEAIGGEGKVFVLTAVTGAESCNLRDQGFISEMQENWPNIEVINADEQINCNNDVNQAMSIITDILAANPDIKGVFGDNLYACKGAAIAVKESGMDVKVAGFDSDTDVIAMLEEGSILCLAQQRPFMMGYEAASAAYKLAIGEEIEHGIVDTGFAVATKENMNDPEIQELLLA